MKKIFFINILFILIVVNFPLYKVSASEASVCPVTITASNGKNASVLSDSSYRTALSLTCGDSITITSSSEFKSLYIEWNSPVSIWILTVNGKAISCGKNGFLHEYIELETASASAVITVFSDMSVSGIRAYTDGAAPSDVQIWNPPCERADILLYSSHADDEILFFGGILPTYAGERNLRVQVAYFSQYWNGEKIREHEKLDGLWTAGVRNYPVNLGFEDLYSETIEQAANIYDYDTALDKTVELIRKFRPQIVIAQDFNGEYGHGTHKLTAKLTAEAVELSGNSEFAPYSTALYGTWDVPKTYLHLYEENQIILDCRTPLNFFNGKTCLEVAKEAYLKHESQQWCWFYVSDTYKYSCASFGLYRTTVGYDTINDIIENIISYEEQETAEQAKKEAEKENQIKWQRTILEKDFTKIIYKSLFSGDIFRY